MRERGRRVVCVGIRGEVDPELNADVDSFRVLGVGRLGACFRFLRRHGVREVSWAGWIRKDRLFQSGIWRHLPDWRALRFWFFRAARRNRQSQTMLKIMADEFEREGFHIAHSAHYCPEILVEPGVLTKRSPSRSELEDIAFGWRIAKRMADLDVGQSVAVYGKATIAVEGMEGTDRNIQRAGQLCEKGFTVVKLAQDGHDMRFDVPAVGPLTIEALHAAGGRVLAIEARKTLILERDEFLRLADGYRIVVAAYEEPPTDGRE